MTRGEIRKEIRDKSKVVKEFENRIQTSTNANEIILLKAKIAKLNEDIDKLQEELDALLDAEEPKKPEGGSSEVSEPKNPEPENGATRNAELKNAEFIRGIYGGNASFKYGQETSTKPNNVETLALRSNETLVSRLPQSEQRNLDLGKLVRGAVTGNWKDALEERNAISTSSAGVLIPQVLSAQVIDKARNISLFASAGVPIVPMESGNMTIARVKNDPEFAFKEELAEASESNFELDSVELKSKTAYGYAYVSIEAIESARNLQDILHNVFSQALADMCDRGMLYGQNGDSFAPSGVLNDTDIHSIVANNLYYDDFIKAMGKIKRCNGIPTVMGINAGTEEQLALVKDSNGNTLAMPPSLASLKQVVSNQLAEDETEGSDALVFDPKAMIIGIQNNLRFKIIDSTDYCIKNGAIGFQIYSMLDCAIVQPKHICKITGLKELQVP